MDLSNYTVKVNEPYPEIEGAVASPTTVQILKNLAFGKMGELGGILTYIFQSNIADKTDDDLGELFEEIAITEMVHLNLIMHAITLFGGTPKYENENGVFFNTAWLDYSTKLKDMLEHNIAGEQQAIANYGEAIKRVNNDSLKQLFNRIIKDEQLHLNVFTHLKDSVQFLSI